MSCDKTRQIFSKHPDTIFFCACDRLFLTASHFFHGLLLVMLYHCMTMVCFACQWTVCTVHNDFSVCGVCACENCLRLYVCLMCGAGFALLHVVYRKHPNLSSHCTVSSSSSSPQGYRYCYDLSTLHVWFVIWSALCGLLFDSLVSWFEIATE